MYLQIENADTKWREGKESLLEDAFYLISQLANADNTVENCVKGIIELPYFQKRKLIKDPLFNLFLFELNEEIIKIFDRKKEIKINETLKNYVNAFQYAISHLTKNKSTNDEVDYSFHADTLIPGTDFLIRLSEKDNIPHVFMPQIEGIKILNFPVEPFYSESVIYNSVFDFETDNWIPILKEALELVKCNSNCQELISNFVSIIYPLKRANAFEDFSFTSRSLPNVIFKNREDTAYLFGESMVHEADHSFFYALESIYSFWKQADNQPSIYFSPWRDDPRPLIGILRGLSAFARVSMFYYSIINFQETQNHQTIGRLLSFKLIQCKNAVSTLIKSKELSTTGVELVTEIAEIIDRIDASLKVNNSYKEWMLGAEQKLQLKKENWFQKNNKFKIIE